MHAFEGMSPAGDVAAADAEWALSRMRERTGVARVVPDRFPAVVRVMHELDSDLTGPVRWSDALPDYLRTGPTAHLYDQIAPYRADDGTLTRDYLRWLLPLLTEATTTPRSSWYAVWRGWGNLTGSSSIVVLMSGTGDLTRAQVEAEQLRVQQAHAVAGQVAERFVASCAELPWWGGRDMALMSGPLSAVHALGGSLVEPEGVSALGPQMWWPTDRAWFMGNEIDDAWTYLAASRPVVDAVLGLHRQGVLEAYEVSFDQRW